MTISGRGKSPHLAILDWGIGGLGLYRAVKRDMRGTAVTYWSDAGFAPYGTVEAKVLVARVRSIATALAARGVTHLAVACNAASTVLPKLASTSGLPELSGVIEHGVRATKQLMAHRTGTVGVVAGARTIKSGAYRREFADFDVIQRVAQPLSALVEKGRLRGPALELELDTIMQPLAGVSVLVLGCTHYTALLTQFAQRAPTAKLVDPSEHMWMWMKRNWPMKRMRRGRDLFLTTGNVVQMRRAALAAFHVRLKVIERARLAP